MIKFKTFLFEAVTDTSKLSHLDHASSLAMHPEHFDTSQSFLSNIIVCELSVACNPFSSFTIAEYLICAVGKIRF